MELLAASFRGKQVLNQQQATTCNNIQQRLDYKTIDPLTKLNQSKHAPTLAGSSRSYVGRKPRIERIESPLSGNQAP